MTQPSSIRIYGKNAIGTFGGGFISVAEEIAPIVWVVHIALLPATLTIGAGTKTAIDVHTRNPLEEREKAQKIEQIKRIPDTAIDEVIAQLVTLTEKKNASFFHSQSDSSKQLFFDLTNADLQANSEVNRYRQQRLLIHEGDVANRLEQSTGATVEVKKLPVQERNKLETEVTQFMNQQRPSTQGKKRQILLAYAANPDNDGKFTQLKLFEEASKLATSTPSPA